MKRKFKIVPRWEPEQRFALPLHYQVPVARRAPELIPGILQFPGEEFWRSLTPLR
jgi:hypothetical protein